MADTRDKDLTRTSAPALDDVARLDGATNGTRGILVSDLLSPIAARAPRGGIVSTAVTVIGTILHNSGFDPIATGNFTFGFWWRGTATTTVFNKSNGGTNGVYIAVTTTAARLWLGDGTGSSFDFPTTSLLDGNWHFIAGWITRGGNAQLYDNALPIGAPQSTAARSGSIAATSASAIWSGTTGSGLSEFWIVVGLLTASRIADINRGGSIAPFCVMTPNAVTGQNDVTVDGLPFITWPDFDKGYSVGGFIPDRSGKNQHPIMGTSSLFHAVRRTPPGRSQRSPRTALVCDGSAGSFVRNIQNAQNWGTGDGTLVFDGTLPVADSTSRTLVALSPSATQAVSGRALWVDWSTVGGLEVTIYGATTADARIKYNAALATLLAGVTCKIAFPRSSLGMRVMIDVAGDTLDITNQFQETAAGSSPPAWTDQVDGQYLIGAYRNSTISTACSIYDLQSRNHAITEAQWREQCASGEVQAKWARGQKAVYVSNFSAGADGVYGPANTTVIGNVDGINGQDDWISVQRTTASGAGIVQWTKSLVGLLSGSVLIPGEVIEVKILLFNASATPRYFSAGFSGYYTASQKVTVGATSQVDATIQFTLPDAGAGTNYTNLRITAVQADGINPDPTVPEGDIFYAKNIAVQRYGVTASLGTDLSAVPTLINDRAENGSSHFLTSLTGVTMSPDSRRQIIPAGTLTFTAGQTLQLFGAGVINTAKKWRIVSISGTASTATNLSAGNASNGAQYVSAQSITGDFDVGTFVTRRTSGANFWLTSSAACTITDAVVILEQVN